MSEEHPIPKMMLMTSNVLGAMEEADQNIAPLPEQLEAKPGDYGMIAFGSSTIEHDLVIAQILDPFDRADQFPDLQDRLWKGYVLCRWLSLNDPDGDIGWFSRVKFVPVTKEQYEEIEVWFTEHKAPDQVPEWLDDIYTGYNVRIHAQAPDRVPAVIPCEACGSFKNQLHIRTLEKYSGRAGKIVKNDQPLYYILSDPEHKEETTAHLHCKECGHRTQINPDHLGGNHDEGPSVHIHRL